MSWGRSSGIDVSEPEQVWGAELCVTRAPAFGDFKEAKRFAFANSGCDLLSVNAVPHEVVEGDGQLSVVLAAVVPEFDF